MCAPFLEREMALLQDLAVVVALGHFAYAALARQLDLTPRPASATGWRLSRHRG